jgi:hypothetical protein
MAFRKEESGEMQATSLIRFSAAAAIVAGSLRVGSSFLGPRLGTTAAELLYLVIDIGFVLAIPGAYLSRHAQLGIAGFVGFLLALCGAASIVGPDGELAGVQMYLLGGGVLVLGLGILGAAQLRLGAQRLGPRSAGSQRDARVRRSFAVRHCARSRPSTNRCALMLAWNSRARFNCDGQSRVVTQARRAAAFRAG